LLEKIYKKFDKEVFSTFLETNPCSNCYICCTSKYSQKVSELELAYLKDFIIKNHLLEVYYKDFIHFLDLRMKKGNKEPETVCPFYDISLNKCIVYPARPFSCRIFGNFAFSFDSIPASCIYYNKVKVIKEKDLIKIPQMDSLASLVAVWRVLHLFSFKKQKLTVQSR